MGHVVSELHAQQVVHIRAESFSMRSAISGVSDALPCSRSDSVARQTFRISAAFETVSPSASMISALIRSPGWGGVFIGMVAGRFFVVTEDQPPVSIPETANLMETPGGFKRQQQLP
jgi:hypothetical protein